MKTLTDQLSKYAEYHRNPRNIATHFVGVPLIVAAVTVLLSKSTLAVAGTSVSAAVVCAAAAIVYYLLLDPGIGTVMALLLGACVWLGGWAVAEGTAVWLALGVGGFVVGWATQFLGHHFEGRKPAFVDDIVGLLIGPVFVVAELMFLLGLRPELKASVEARAGGLRPGARVPS